MELIVITKINENMVHILYSDNTCKDISIFNIKEMYINGEIDMDLRSKILLVKALGTTIEELDEEKEAEPISLLDAVKDIDILDTTLNNTRIKMNKIANEHIEEDKNKDDYYYGGGY